MRNKDIAMNGPYSFNMKAVMSDSMWGKKRLMNFAHTVRRNFGELYLLDPSTPVLFLPFFVMLGLPMSLIVHIT